MTDPQRPAPEQNAIVPYITVRGAAEAIAFYSAAFGAVEDFRLVDPADGRIGHAELLIGGSRLMLSDEYPDFGALSPDSLGGTPVKLHMQVADADAAVARASAAGATVLRPPTDQFFGERSAMLADPFGHGWVLSQHVETLTGAQMQARWNAGPTG
jgi:uncharacterized glyoxalase superfamily protein PhnB